YAVLDHDDGVVLARERRAVAPGPDVRAELDREVLREREREELLPRPERGAVLVLAGGRRERVVELREEVRHLALRERRVLVREQERRRDVVVQHPDDGTAVARGEDVLLDLHEDLRLGPGLLA